jgi:hypothetical protein
MAASLLVESEAGGRLALYFFDAGRRGVKATLTGISSYNGSSPWAKAAPVIRNFLSES